MNTIATQAALVLGRLAADAGKAYRLESVPRVGSCVVTLMQAMVNNLKEAK